MGTACLTTSIEQLNRDCLCLSLDEAALARALDAELGEARLSQLVRERCPYLFAAQPVFVDPAHVARMSRVVRAVESVAALPAYREQVLAEAPASARVDAGAQGVFFGYDFHLHGGSLGLVEVNTNAGGAMLNAVLARAQRSCCEPMDAMVPTAAGVEAFEQRMIDMFRREWRRSGHSRPLASIAIVDSVPQAQYLYPEFLLFRRLFARAGIEAVIADPAELAFSDGRLRHAELPIDLVYNRLTDFYLEDAASAALRDAWLARAIVLTPHPQAHALYADKRRLAVFSDDDRLRALGAPEAVRRVLLETVPHTEIVRADAADRLWAARRGLFFKPVAGYGSRAAYRGDKLTRRVWDDILAGDYVAQALVSPGERRVDSQQNARAMKFDLRAYAYAGDVQWIAARLYQGQTTNFRTPGGGFAPVYSTVDASGRIRVGDEDAHASYVFLLDDLGEVHPLPHALYVALARRQATAPLLARRVLRVADWYVRMHDGEPASIANETYALARFDEQGGFQQTPADADSAWPTPEERGRMEAMLFAARD